MTSLVEIISILTSDHSRHGAGIMRRNLKAIFNVLFALSEKFEMLSFPFANIYWLYAWLCSLFRGDDWWIGRVVENHVANSTNLEVLVKTCVNWWYKIYKVMSSLRILTKCVTITVVLLPGRERFGEGREARCQCVEVELYWDFKVCDYFNNFLHILNNMISSCMPFWLPADFGPTIHDSALTATANS